MSKFGWSYPAGCSGPPDDDLRPEWTNTPRCSHCGKWARHDIPMRSKHCQSEARACDGKPMQLDDLLLNAPCGDWKVHEPHEFHDSDWTEVTFDCPHCGKESKEVIV